MFLGKMTRAGIGMIAALGLSTSIASAQESVEVLHWWTAGGEAKALQVLKKDLEDQGVSWNDMPVAGGGGEQAMTVLRARVTSGNAPTAVQMLGFDIKDWAGEDVLANLDALAEKEGWEEVVPDALKDFSKHDGHWIAAPVNVHSTNWVWANKAIFEELDLKQPTNWDELIAALDKIKDAGYTAVAHGGQAWQDATIFDAVVMATGGPEFYQASMIDTDPDALGSDTMKTVFDRMAKLRTYVDDNFSGRDWNLATAMVINKEAGVQFMGDWAKGEFLNAGKVPDTDFMCFRFPGTQDAVTFNSDQFVMFKVGEDRQDAQMKLASAVMSPSFQSAFNVVKGSVPARTDVSNDAFDACGKKGMAELAAANKKGTLFGSMAHGHSVPAGVKNAMYDVITAHFNGEYDSATAAEELVNAVASAQ
ncbi:MULTISPECIES: ABC transporter substrate-binding protein [Thalassospira]|jgi:glucose/mannose transport system substrate-binding protein|uniref:Probable sugar-binding periplasmic protein n=1 Tax=Thalassospira lohafexi TaxID=744227 RepID=A0A2N3LBU6_9PROT|nr:MULTISPECIES: ABC transporter substrate-binding protein [Thalassospira]PKR60249.1 sugar ABC transporter substrate-binding protein [Thalassospira lohafexi]|tara:strand:- start:366 stop:1625 length:1260 start_codon:yes stop_codon:yes gene_type:complete